MAKGLLQPMFVGSERRWCYGYHEGPDKPEFHVCRNRGHYRYIVYRMARFGDSYGVMGGGSYGLTMFSYARTLAEAEAMIGRKLNGQKAETVWV